MILPIPHDMVTIDQNSIKLFLQSIRENPHSVLELPLPKKGRDFFMKKFPSNDHLGCYDSYEEIWGIFDTKIRSGKIFTLGEYLKSVDFSRNDFTDVGKYLFLFVKNILCNIEDNIILDNIIKIRIIMTESLEGFYKKSWNWHRDESFEKVLRILVPLKIVENDVGLELVDNPPFLLRVGYFYVWDTAKYHRIWLRSFTKSCNVLILVQISVKYFLAMRDL